MLVLLKDDCEQNEQSSGHLPDLAFTNFSTSMKSPLNPCYSVGTVR